MQTKGTWRRVANLTPAVLLCVAVAVACRDSLQPERQSDEWAGSVLEQMRVTTHVRIFDDQGRAHRLPESKTATMTAMSYPVAEDYATNGFAFKKQPLVHYRHNRDSTGALLTLAFVQDGPGAPPKRVYGFRNGVIQFVFSPRYKQRGNRWVREALRVTAFKEGKLLAQIDANALDSGQGANLTFAPRDASYSESELVNEQSGSGSCWSEFSSAFAAYLVWVGSLGYGAAKLGTCALFQTVTPDCATLTAIAGGSLVAFNEYVRRIEVLSACEMRQWIQNTNPVSGNPDAWDPIAAAPKSGLAAEWIAAANEFIAASEGAGAVVCNSDGSVCTYYAPQV